MRRALLDTNFLLALLDPLHVHHDLAHDWFARQSPSGWASCPITQNGYVRIASQPAYPNALLPADAACLLTELTSREDHQFWPDSVSILDASLCLSAKFASARQITDSYLLALAVANEGALGTFDRKLSTEAIVGGTDSLSVIAR